jgi:hypothetical protein
MCVDLAKSYVGVSWRNHHLHAGPINAALLRTCLKVVATISCTSDLTIRDMMAAWAHFGTSSAVVEVGVLPRATADRSRWDRLSGTG